MHGFNFRNIIIAALAIIVCAYNKYVISNPINTMVDNNELDAIISKFKKIFKYYSSNIKIRIKYNPKKALKKFK